MNGQRVFGALYAPDKTTFTLWAPGSSAVLLQLYPTGSDEEESSRMIGCYPMENDGDGCFTASIDGDLHGIYYTYQLTYRSGYGTISADPWARACGVNGVRSMVVDLARTDPEGWQDDRPIGRADMAPVVW